MSEFCPTATTANEVTNIAFAVAFQCAVCLSKRHIRVGRVVFAHVECVRQGHAFCLAVAPS
eukprot:1134690-Lingulodinium_polyedra.AAC.1